MLKNTWVHHWTVYPVPSHHPPVCLLLTVAGSLEEDKKNVLPFVCFYGGFFVFPF